MRPLKQLHESLNPRLGVQIADMLRSARRGAYVGVFVSCIFVALSFPLMFSCDDGALEGVGCVVLLLLEWLVVPVFYPLDRFEL